MKNKHKMIESKLTLDILDLFFDGEKDVELFKMQIKHLTIFEIEYTGIGVFITFECDEEIYKYRANLDFINGNSSTILDGIVLKNKNLNIEASVMIRLDDGIIKSIEIFNSNGFDYPKYELEHYEIYQNWDNYNRKIIR
jgi:hypothetical protein